MRRVFIESRKLALLDDGIIILFLSLTIHKMSTELFDESNKCIWDHDTFKADIIDTISRFIMLYAVLYLSDHFAKKVYYILYIYIYIDIDIYIYIYLHIYMPIISLNPPFKVKGKDNYIIFINYLENSMLKGTGRRN